jgi:hypothetical protein
MDLVTTTCYPQDYHLSNVRSEDSKIHKLLPYSVMKVGEIHNSTCPTTRCRNPEDGSMCSIEAAVSFEVLPLYQLYLSEAYKSHGVFTVPGFILQSAHDTTTHRKELKQTTGNNFRPLSCNTQTAELKTEKLLAPSLQNRVALVVECMSDLIINIFSYGVYEL